MVWRDAAIMGLLATALIDLWQMALRRSGLSTSNWGYVGRWIGSFPKGVFAHPAISQSPKVPGERVIGWSFHYLVGLGYAALYLAILGAFGLGAPTLWSAAAFGLATVVAPWFVMQPALGAGVFSTKAPKPMQARFVSASTHLVFGVGLYLGARIAGR